MSATTSDNATSSNATRTLRPLVFGTVRWQVRPGWEPVLFDVTGFRLSGWLDRREAVSIRDRKRRAVYRVEIDGTATPKRFYVKHAKCGGLIGVLRNLVRGSDARREWQNAQEALRRDVSTAMPVAWGEDVRGGLVRDSFFVSQEIDDAVPLDRFWAAIDKCRSSDDRCEQRRELNDGLACFVAALHEAGIAHGDFHAGNILVQKACYGTECPRLFLIDMAAVRFGRPLSWPESRKNLIVLNAEWFDRTTPRERWRFWRSYLSRRPRLAVPHRAEIAKDLDRASREHSRRIDRHRDRRALKTNRDFFSITRSAVDADGKRQFWRAHAVADLARAELEKLLENPEPLLLENLGRPVKLGHSSVVVRATLALDGGPRSVCYKRHRAKNAKKAFLNLFRSSRAMRSWRLGHAFLSRRIDTPRPVLVCEPARAFSTRPWRNSTAYLAVEWIDGAKNLHLWAWSLSKLPQEERMRRAYECARSLGRLVGRMHSRQISHGDLKGSNILVADDDAGAEIRPPKTLLIDLDAARIHKRLPQKRQVADLARLVTSLAAHSWAGNSLVRRFWASYTAEFPRGTIDRHSLWRAVADRNKKLIGKKQKRGENVL